MSDKNKPETSLHDQPTNESHDPYAESGSGVGSSDTDRENLSSETMVAAIEALQAENDGLKDRVLRTMADMENLRRRAEREKTETAQYATTSFARDMVTVADNFSRALAAMPSEALDSADEATRNLVAGIEMTEREMQNVLERHGVKRFDPSGERFDPNLHQAMFEVDDPNTPSGTVVQVMQTGYKIGERVLRPALVGVSKGGPRLTNS